MHKYLVNVCYTTNLSYEEFSRRYTYLPTLKRLTQIAPIIPGRSLYQNINRALNKHENFTGRLKLNYSHCEYLSDLLSRCDKDSLEYSAIKYYLNMN